MTVVDQVIFNGLLPLNPGLKVLVCLDRSFRSPSLLNLMTSLYLSDVNVTGKPAKFHASCSIQATSSAIEDSVSSNNWRVFFSWSQNPS